MAAHDLGERVGERRHIHLVDRAVERSGDPVAEVAARGVEVGLGRRVGDREDLVGERPVVVEDEGETHARELRAPRRQHTPDIAEVEDRDAVIGGEQEVSRVRSAWKSPSRKIIVR